jgi:hypothetical protein
MSDLQKFLEGLAQFDHPKIEKPLNDQADQIEQKLLNSIEYEILVEELDKLSGIAHRISPKAVKILESFLKIIDRIEFTYRPISGVLYDFKEYKNKSTLTVKTLNLLDHIKYHETVAVLPIFLEYALHPDSDIKKQAERSLEAIASYNIDVLRQIGFHPQEVIIEYLQSLNDHTLEKYVAPIISLCRGLLSSTIHGESWYADTITISRGGIRTEERLRSIRHSSIQLLKKLYSFANTVVLKKRVLGAIQEATRAPDVRVDDTDTHAMIAEDTIEVLKFFSELALKEEMEVLQDIEHDSFWINYHRGNSTGVKEAALKIRDQLDANKEYWIFKVLIGFEGVFEDWEQARKKDFDKFEEIRKLRDSEARRFVSEITADNFNEWKDRILSYAKIESEDLATFPHFGKFLEHFGVESPDLALTLIKENTPQLERFLIAILSGLWQSDKIKAKELMTQWAVDGKYLAQSIRLFTHTKDIDLELLDTLLKQAIAKNDTIALIYIISAIAYNFTKNRKELISRFFIPSLGVLTKNRDARWIFDFWYRQNKGEILKSFSEKEVHAVLENLLFLDSIDHQVESVLKTISQKYPEQVIHYFGKRIAEQKEVKLVGGYEPIPYDFHDLAEALSTIPDQAVDIVRSWYRKNDFGMFSHRGGRLLSNIFPNFSEGFERKLISIVQAGKKDDWLFVLAILRNYQGEIFLHNVCKELVRVVPSGSLTNQLHITLEATGVVSGSLGFIEAYNRKIKEIEPWLNDKDKTVRKFATDHIARLQYNIDREHKRAKEEEELRNYRYGLKKE